MKIIASLLGLILIATVGIESANAQPSATTSNAPAGATPPAGGGRRGGGGPVLSVSTTAWPDGGEIPMKNAGRGENQSPAFDFHWSQAGNPTNAPATLQTYTIVLHDVENSSMRGTGDTLHWTIFNIPGTVKSISEGLAAGDLPDGSRQGPGVRGGSYFGPGAGVGPFHHYVFEFYALDTKLDLQASATRDQLMTAMEGHVVGKAAYVGRFHAVPQP